MLNLNLPETETARLIIRPIQLEDASDLYEIASDQRVNRYLLYPRHQSVDQSREIISRIFLNRTANGLPSAYVLVDKLSGKMIGTCDYVKVEYQTSAEIGYSLNYNYWNRGLMSEAVKKVIEVGFDYIGLSRISIVHSVLNIGSQRVIEKCGFVYEGTYRKYLPDKETGSYVDAKHYSILKEEWRNEL
ncbi:MAG: GNAT family protein [Erysipelotrichaceae bacterium]|nr:GNAT family protein [Erysipelotrichaceae bacterium]